MGSSEVSILKFPAPPEILNLWCYIPTFYLVNYLKAIFVGGVRKGGGRLTSHENTHLKQKSKSKKVGSSLPFPSEV